MSINLVRLILALTPLLACTSQWSQVSFILTLFSLTLLSSFFLIKVLTSFVVQEHCFLLRTLVFLFLTTLIVGAGKIFFPYLSESVFPYQWLLFLSCVWAFCEEESFSLVGVVKVILFSALILSGVTLVRVGITPQWNLPLMTLPAGAFFTVGLILWIVGSRK